MQLKQGGSDFLDLLRGAASQVVLIGHAISYFGIWAFLRPPSVPWMQNFAVVIFFVLSGFVITRSVDRRTSSGQSYGFYDYFIDRFARVYGGFIPAILVVALIDGISTAVDASAYSYSAAFSIQTFFANLLMLQDFPYKEMVGLSCCTSFGSARPFWTLAIEWWIYMAFGYSFLVLARGITLYRLVVTAMLFIVPAFNLIEGRGNGLTAAWLFGSLAYTLFSGRTAPFGSGGIKLLFIALSLAAAYYRAELVGVDAYDPIVAFCLANALLLGVMIANSYRFSPAMRRIISISAGYSYTLYLIHYSILDFLKAHMGHMNPYSLFVLGFILANGISYFLAKASEGFLTDVFRQAFSRRDPALGVVAEPLMDEKPVRAVS